ncbi:hypothetical protein Syun_025540 [Stephania yunnanensis]|uniref:Uncharacterized protein n=1 Tax=Stephania yunnanensis TaxID=152371 RepID=A0AAP0EUG0_9MAGN
MQSQIDNIYACLEKAGIQLSINVNLVIHRHYCLYLKFINYVLITNETIN